MTSRLEKCPPEEQLRYKGYPPAYVKDHIRLCQDLDRELHSDGQGEPSYIEQKKALARIAMFCKAEIVLLIRHKLLRRSLWKEY